MHKVYTLPENVTYGQDFLLKLLDKRKLGEFWNKNFSELYDFSHIFYIAIGKLTPPSLPFIMSMYNFVEPHLWFYTVSENKPESLKDSSKLVNNITLSINFAKLEKMYSEKTLYKFCKENEISYSNIYHIINKRNKISPQQILKLKNLFNPLEWFISE